MHFKTMLVASIAFTGLAVCGGNATGQDVFTWTGADATDGSVWKDADNWSSSGGGYPVDAGDKAIIRFVDGEPDPILDLAGANLTIGDLLVEDDGYLIIRDTTGADNMLILTNTDASRDGKLVMEVGALMDIGAGGAMQFANGVTHEIGGDLRLLSSTSDLLVYWNVTFGPYDPTGTPDYGMIEGQDNDARIQIKAHNVLTSSYTLTNEISIAGRMTVEPIAADGKAIFKNGSTGVVEANVAGKLKLAADLDVSDVAGALWAATTNSGAVLEFNEGASLAGDFLVDDCATIRFLANVETTGDLDQVEGTIDTDGAGVPAFGYDCPSCTVIYGDVTVGDC